MVCGPASTTSHSHHTRDGCVLARALTEVGAASTANAVSQNTVRDSQRVACPLVGPRRIPRGRRERSHGGGGCIHELRAQVLGGAVIKFLLNPCSRKKNHQRRMNGTRTRQRDTLVVMVLISSQRQIQLVRHKSCRDISSSVETPLPMSSRPPPH